MWIVAYIYVIIPGRCITITLGMIYRILFIDSITDYLMRIHPVHVHTLGMAIIAGEAISQALALQTANRKILDMNKSIKNINRRLNTTVESVDSGLVYFDDKGNIKTINKNAVQLLGIQLRHGVWQLVDDYAKGFWTLLTFSMQMSIMMVTGFVIADAPPVKKLIIKLINLPKSVPATIVMFALVCGVVSWIHWGMGLMLTIIMGKEIAIRKKGRGIHYAYIVAIAYTSMNIMANGISQAAPLLSATPGNFLENIMGIIPISQTSLSPFMLVFLRMR